MRKGVSAATAVSAALWPATPLTSDPAHKAQTLLTP